MAPGGRFFSWWRPARRRKVAAAAGSVEFQCKGRFLHGTVALHSSTYSRASSSSSSRIEVILMKDAFEQKWTGLTANGRP